MSALFLLMTFIHERKKYPFRTEIFLTLSLLESHVLEPFESENKAFIGGQHVGVISIMQIRI